MNFLSKDKKRGSIASKDFTKKPKFAGVVGQSQVSFSTTAAAATGLLFPLKRA